MAQILKNLNQIQQDLALISKQKIRLLAVSKKQSVQNIESAYEAGQTIFGESYLQEAIAKQQQLKHLDIEWHFIGPIQSNKCKLIAENFSWVQSVDRIKIANKLNEALTYKASLNICIQINISNESSKGGVNTKNINELAKQINQLDNLVLRGLMAIPSNTNNNEVLLNEYKNLKMIYENLRNKYSLIDTLSMGMSNDYLLAAQNGSNLVRIGTKIFGER
ncbi:MAG: YggS family pyridoxal phosphate-dependent enzyme [Methylophilaceae bacterium]